MLLTLLAMLHLVLAVRTLSVRNMAIEVLLLFGEATVVIAIISPLLIGSSVTVADEDCGRWLRACPDELLWVPLWWVQPVGIALSFGLLVGVTAYALLRK